MDGEANNSDTKTRRYSKESNQLQASRPPAKIMPNVLEKLIIKQQTTFNEIIR